MLRMSSLSRDMHHVGHSHMIFAKIRTFGHLASSSKLMDDKTFESLTHKNHERQKIVFSNTSILNIAAGNCEFTRSDKFVGLLWVEWTPQLPDLGEREPNHGFFRGGLYGRRRGDP